MPPDRRSLYAPGLSAALLVLVVALVLGPEGRGPRLALGAVAVVLIAALWWARQRADDERAPSAPDGEGRSAMDLRDPLTGLPNRRLLHELLGKQLAHAKRAQTQVGVVVCDLDRFKSINDSLGFQRGDELLQQVARRLRGSVRQADVFGRTGGDEFTLVVTRARSPEAVIGAAQRLLACFEERLEVGGREIGISASLGLSLYPTDGSEVEQLLARAEEALGQAKEQGGRCLQVFSPALHLRTRERADFAQELRRALDRSELTTYFQPQVSLADGRITGMEALVRWPHPERGLVSAGTIVPIAEEHGLMNQLGTWLLGAICRQNARWCEAGLCRLPVSVNVSIRQFQRGGVAGVVERALEASGLDPELLHLEITESIALIDIERISRSLARIKGLGVKIELDDFGTGYSSLSYLVHYPVDVLKIDREFVAGALDSHQSAMLVELTIELARRLGLEVIAEGVETARQLDFLRDRGCPVAQGFLFARPLPASELEPLLRRGAISLDPPASATQPGDG